MSNCKISATFHSFGTGFKRRVIVTPNIGSQLKTSAVTDDIQTIGEDDTGKKSTSSKAQKVNKAEALQYDVNVEHGNSFAKTHIRVKCSDSTWSNWIVVAK